MMTSDTPSALPEPASESDTWDGGQHLSRSDDLVGFELQPAPRRQCGEYQVADHSQWKIDGWTVWVRAPRHAFLLFCGLFFPCRGSSHFGAMLASPTSHRTIFRSSTAMLYSTGTSSSVMNVATAKPPICA